MMAQGYWSEIIVFVRFGLVNYNNKDVKKIPLSRFRESTLDQASNDMMA
jgi:hypothetical protein